MRQTIKRVVDWCCLWIVAPCAWMCALEAARDRRHEAVFTFWAQVFALGPGLPGLFLRRAFYRWTLDRCARDFFVGFGALFSHRRSIVEDDVYIGPYAIVGSSTLRRGCLIGSRAGIISGTQLHELESDGRRAPTDISRLHQVDIGEYAWIGEAALVMADVGQSAVVAAGSVVSSRVLPAIVVAGNPARFVKRLTDRADHMEEPAGVTQ